MKKIVRNMSSSESRELWGASNVLRSKLTNGRRGSTEGSMVVVEVAQRARRRARWGRHGREPMAGLPVRSARPAWPAVAADRWVIVGSAMLASRKYGELLREAQRSGIIALWS